MRFTLTGTVGKSKISVTWHDGALEGEGPGNMLLESLAKALEGRSVSLSPGAPPTSTDHLSDPFSTIALFREIAEDVQIYGDKPVLPDVGEGNVA